MTHFTAVKELFRNICSQDRQKEKLSHPWLEKELSLRLQTEFVAAFPQQQGAENSNDAEVEEEAEEERPHGPQEGGHRSLGDEQGFPRHHVRYDRLHLEVCPHHSADVEELVAVAWETRSARHSLLEAGGNKHSVAGTCHRVPHTHVLFCLRQRRSGLWLRSFSHFIQPRNPDSNFTATKISPATEAIFPITARSLCD